MPLGKNMNTRDNRRQLERFSMHIPTKVSQVMHDHPEQLLPTTNISAGGVFFKTDNIYPVGTKVVLNIALDFGNGKMAMPASRFKVEGTVARTDPNGMAITFDPEHVSSIRVGPPRKPGRATTPMIGIVGSDPLLNDLLAARISSETGASCCHSTSMPKILETARPDLTLLDCSELSIAELLEETGGEASPFIQTSVALFNVSTTEDKTIELDVINSGIRGLFYRNTSFALLAKGINAMLDNELWFSREAMSAYLLGRQKKQADPSCEASEESEELSQREKEILLMLSAGATNKDIADKLYLSLNTIKSHIYNIYKKIDVPNRLQASLWATKYLKNEDMP